MFPRRAGTRMTGKAKSNLSRSLCSTEGYDLVHLEGGERRCIVPS
jgi:hypothetical protein